LEQAFQNNGMQAEDLGMTINKMQKYLVEAGDSGSEAAYHIAGLGLSMADLQKMSPDQQFEAIGKAIAGISDPSERSAASMGIFGKSGARLLAFFNDFNGSIETAKQEVGSYADLMDSKSRAFDELGDSVSAIGKKFVQFTSGLIEDTLPLFQEFADKLKGMNATDAGKKFGETFRNGVLAAVSVGIDPGNLFLAFTDSWVGMLTKIENAFHNSIRYMGDFIVEMFKSLSSSLGDMMGIALKLPAMQFLDLIAAGLANIAAIMPGTMSKAIGDAAANLQNTTKRMQLDIEAAQERASNFTMKALGAAYSNTTYKNTDFYNEKENFDSAKKRLADNQALAESAFGSKSTTSDSKKPSNSGSSGAEGVGGSSGAGSGGVGGASWKAKMAPIIDAASVATGLYKNTGNLGLDMQELLAGSSMEISSQMGKLFDPRIATAQKTGNFTGAASLMREKAVQTQAQQENDLRRSQFEAGGYGRAAAQQRVDEEKAKYGRLLTDSVNKTNGPLGSGSSAGGPGTGIQKSPEAVAVESVKQVVKDIYDYMQKSLPQHALTA
jgi:hypothetical protein